MEHPEGERAHQRGRYPRRVVGTAKTVQQMDTDARWIKMNGINHYGYKNNISVDVKHGFIRRYIVTTANVHDSQMLPALVDPTNDPNSLWVDSAFAGLIYRSFLRSPGINVISIKIVRVIPPLSVDPKAGIV